jgi:ribosomal protein S27E
VDSIECENCGELVVAPLNREPRARTVTVACIDCRTKWIFVYDETGRCIDCRPFGTD